MGLSILGAYNICVWLDLASSVFADISRVRGRWLELCSMFVFVINVHLGN